MKANATSLLGIFESKLRLEVPLFQRQYVWNRDQQWEPLWEDISRKFIEYLEGRKDAPVHFLGAMVLDQKQTPTTHVVKRQVIDGQQRLTTLQIFLSVFRDYCNSKDCGTLGDECRRFTLNGGMMNDPEVEQFKVWPTTLDRQQFMDVISSGSRVEIEKRHPLVKKKFTRKFHPRPRMIEAYLYFYDEFVEFFEGVNGERALCSDTPLASRLEECFQALKNALLVVAIDLEADDDAQVIFETLNARGEPLLPADLLRNYIFLRAARMGESQEELYLKYWSNFDDEFWRKEVKQGRLNRPRSDLYLQHFLASRKTVDIPIKHLFVEYKHWIEKENPYSKVEDELAALSRQGSDFKRIISPSKDDLLFQFSKFLEDYDVRTIYPLLLAFLDSNISDVELKAVIIHLESYLLRRAVCGYTTKNYNRVFLQLTRSLKNQGMNSERLKENLSKLSGESSVWPENDTFKASWMTNHAYRNLSNPKLVHIFRQLNDTYMSVKSEELTIESKLTVEHILPQAWIENWPLPNGNKGLSGSDLYGEEHDNETAQATHRRNALLQTVGNLTIITQPLNSSVKNSPWETKKTELLKSSLLPINQQLHSIKEWDEKTVENRGMELFERAIKIWPK